MSTLRVKCSFLHTPKCFIGFCIGFSSLKFKIVGPVIGECVLVNLVLLVPPVDPPRGIIVRFIENL